MTLLTDLNAWYYPFHVRVAITTYLSTICRQMRPPALPTLFAEIRSRTRRGNR